MKFKVIIEEPAQQDLEAIVLWIAQDSETAAREWYWRVREALASLAHSPKRCPLAPESGAFEEEIRHRFHGRSKHVYRILFVIRGRCVHVLHVRHGAREPLRPI